MTIPHVDTGLGSEQQPPTSNRRLLLLVFVVSFAVSLAIRAWAPAGWSRAFEFALLVAGKNHVSDHRDQQK